MALQPALLDPLLSHPFLPSFGGAGSQSSSSSNRLRGARQTLAPHQRVGRNFGRACPEILGLTAAGIARRLQRRRTGQHAAAGGTWNDRLDGGRPLRVIIVGGGPGGLALARGLINIPGLDICILEGRPEVKTGTKNKGRSHTIGLGRRAREAICQLGGQSAWDELSAKGIMADGFTLHLNGVPLSLPPPEGEPVVLVDRSSIVSALKDELFANDFAEGTDVRIEYSSRVLSVDVVHRRIIVVRNQGTPDCKEESLDYDLLIGSDGVRSRVREAMNSQLPPGRFDSELRVMPGRWMVLRVDLPERYSKTSVHAMVASEAPFGLFCIPDKAGPHCVIASWSSDDSPEELLNAKTPAELEAVLLRYYPQLEKIPHDTAEDFLNSAPSKAVVSRCRPLHDADHAICVLGDAAHAVGGGSLGQGCSAALQDAAALAECLREGARLNQELLRSKREEQTQEGVQQWLQVREEALVGSMAAFSDQRAEEAWALLDLIELQSAAEVRANALVQGPLVFGFFIEQLGRGTLRPLADIGSRLLEERIQSNRESSSNEVKQFVGHLQMKPTMKFSPGVLVFLIEQFVLSIWKTVLDLFSRLQPPMQTALMSADESYSQLVCRNQTWLALLRSARVAAGATRISSVRSIRAFSKAEEDVCALLAQNFVVQERLQDDVLLRQSALSDQQNFYAILTGICDVMRGGEVVAQLHAGDCFGEASLILQAPSPVSVKAASDVRLLVMEGQVFQELMQKVGQDLQGALQAAAERYGASFAEVEAQQESGRQKVRQVLETVGQESVAKLSNHQQPLDVDRLLGTAGFESYAMGDLVALGCQRLRVLGQGVCNVVRSGRTVRTLKAGNFFGPDLTKDERVVASSDDVLVCSFTNEAVTSMGLLLNRQTV